MPDKRTGIEPHRMTLPTMDRPSVTFAWMLDSVVIEDMAAGDGGPPELYLTCKECGDSICPVETGDTLRVLFNTALAHTCG